MKSDNLFETTRRTRFSSVRIARGALDGAYLPYMVY